MRRVFEVDGLFAGARTMTNAALVIDGAEVGDPLEDLGVLRSPKGVYARGVAAV